MIRENEFRERWNDNDDSDPLVTFSAGSLHNISIPNDCKSFLSAAGLPKSAAPFLDFTAPPNDSLPTAAELWKLSPHFNHYHVIGSNGSGDSICIDESRNGQIVYLNHDDAFRRVLINSSVFQMAELLLAYRHVVVETQRRNGEDAFLDGDVPPELQQWLLAEMIRIDPVASHADCFWPQELEILREDAI